MEEEYAVIKDDQRFVTQVAKMGLDKAREIFGRHDKGYRLVRVSNYPAFKDEDVWVFPVVAVLKSK